MSKEETNEQGNDGLAVTPEVVKEDKTETPVEITTDITPPAA